MKIAMIYDAVYPYVKGGVEKRISDIAERLSDKHEIHVFGMKYWKGPRLMKKGNVIYHGVCRPVKLYTRSGRRSLFEPFYFSINLLPALLKSDFDIIDCQNFPYLPCFSAMIYSKLKKRPLVITWCEAWGDYWHEYMGISGLLGKNIERITAKLTENNISLSELTAKNLLSLGVKSKVIEPAIDSRALKKGKGRKKAFDVVFMGRFIREKNIDVLVKAINLTEANAVIIGDGPEKNRISSLVKSLRMEERVKLTGFLEENEALDCLESSRIFVTLSEREGFGIAAAQAMALGMPVITVRGRNNAVSSRVPEEFICSLSEKDVAEKISHLLKKDITGIRYPRIENQDDPDKTAKIIGDYYADIVNNPAGS